MSALPGDKKWPCVHHWYAAGDGLRCRYCDLLKRNWTKPETYLERLLRQPIEVIKEDG